MLTNLKKNMPRLFVLFAVATFLSGSMVASALAAEFANPPETYAPEWTEPFPYQPDIYWDFSTDPTSNPATEAAFQPPFLKLHQSKDGRDQGAKTPKL
ncbi:MAG: hypothetical protein JRF30_00260 [Deltaproteobacteria bacterium]|nr:hypothetical protein [Deltaproteobacteria bacterium]